jgi:hypothetical protein
MLPNDAAEGREADTVTLFASWPAEYSGTLIASIIRDTSYESRVADNGGFFPGMAVRIVELRRLLVIG